MAGLVKGDVVVIPFPFSDLSKTKRRPALVVAIADDTAVILCQITSQAVRDRDALELGLGDFESGSLRRRSNIRPNRIFTADKQIILYRAGHVTAGKTASVVEKLVEILNR